MAFIIDIIIGRRKKKHLKRSLVNTIQTVILTIAVLTALYSQIWHQGLNEVVIRQGTDNVYTPRFPAVAFFQRMNSAQPNIQPGELKCSSGPRYDHVAQCSSLSITEALRTVSCDCGDSWPSLERLKRGDSTVMWLTQNTTYYDMVPSPSTISKGAGHFLELQIFFTYNTTEAYLNASLTPAPGVWMAIYDPSYDIVQMMKDGQLYTAQIDANSHTVVNIGLKYYTYLNKTSSYKYDVTISTRQNLDFVCDISKDDWWPCHLTVEVQIPSFLRTIIHEERRQDWSRVVADAGAYFALVQFLSWIASGMAWS
ncbi:Nn.00g032190.m01.CDS01 [Neocucurbitaria sp. VM-36]